MFVGICGAIQVKYVRVLSPKCMLLHKTVQLLCALWEHDSEDCISAARLQRVTQLNVINHLPQVNSIISTYLCCFSVWTLKIKPNCFKECLSTGEEGENIFICCQNRLAAQHRARAQPGTAAAWHLQRDTTISPAAGTKGFLWLWRVREGNASLWSAGGRKPKGVLLRLFQVLVEFYPHLSLCWFLSVQRKSKICYPTD